jgi:xanthine dehydrogenase large subunit
MLAISVFSAIADALHSLAPGTSVQLDAPATAESILRMLTSIRRVVVLPAPFSPTSA